MGLMLNGWVQNRCLSLDSCERLDGKEGKWCKLITTEDTKMY